MKPLRVDLTGVSRRLPTALLVGATSLTVLALPTSATAQDSRGKGRGGNATYQLGVDSWGRNGSGQLGDGTITNRNTPVNVQNLAGARSLAAGSYSTYAVPSDGTVRAWGGNGSGQLGDGATADHPTPVTVVGANSHLTFISAPLNGDFSLAA
ncbi:hypothetical protein ACH4E7_41830 [Kitasatospora sp. NPDC018058]|uniref:hypothetical protein n=1 Tax=Kitasatospora sp. NPDC018058 TaxID=3364025 RepID=UPI0037BF07B4